MTDLPASTIIDGRFKVLIRVGGGGMGSVYKAEQLGLDRLVALKVLHKHLLTDIDSLERFQREALVLQSLVHRNISIFYAYGIWQQAMPYIALEFLEGDSLAALLSTNSSLPWRRSLSIIEQVCLALNHAHKSNVIHRDITPANIFILARDNEELVKVTDFGLARIVNFEQQSMQKLTATGMLLGTPQYMSPEQCQGKQIDARTDIYSLGCVLYHLLFAKPPFDADSSIGVIYRQINESLPPLVLGPGVPPQIAELLNTALAKSPDDRFSSAAEMAAKVSQILESAKDQADCRALPQSKLTAKQSSSWTSAVISWKRHKRSLLASLAVLLLILFTSGIALYRHQIKSTTQRNVEDGDGSETKDYHKLFTRGKLYSQGKHWRHADGALSKALAFAQEADDRKMVSLCRLELAKVYMATNQFGHAIDQLEAALPNLSPKTNGSSYDVNYSFVLGALGSNYQSTGRYDKAVVCFQKRLDYARQFRRVDVLWSELGLGQCYAKLHQYEKAVDALNEAMRLKNADLNQEMEEHLELDLAQAYFKLGKRREGGKVLRDMLADSDKGPADEGAEPLLEEARKLLRGKPSKHTKLER